VEVAFALFLVSAWIVNLVVLLPVEAAAAVAPVCHKPFVVTMVVAAENAPPFALEYTYTLFVAFPQSPGASRSRSNVILTPP